jgi:rubrerythrin
MSDIDLIDPERIRPELERGFARRGFLRAAGTATLSATAVALIAGCESMAMQSQTAAAGSAEGDIRILNTAIAAEHEAVAAYAVGAKSGLLKKPVLDLAVQFQGHHKEHVNVLASTVTKLGGRPVSAKRRYNFPVSKLKSQTDVLAFAAGLEKGAVSAYLGAVPILANRDLAKAAASILGDEAMHWAVLRGALGHNPVPAAFVS